MSTDWYDRGVNALHADGVKSTGVSTEDFAAVYAFLYNIGLIDYDVEKEIIIDRYDDGEE